MTRDELEAEVEQLRAENRELRRQLERERARNEGLEQGLTSLSRHAATVRAELAELRAEVELAGQRAPQPAA